MYNDLAKYVLGMLNEQEASKPAEVPSTPSVLTPEAQVPVVTPPTPTPSSAGITADMITGISPSANADIVKGIVDNQGILNKYGINTPARVGMFLAQTAHESDGFKTMNEYGSGAAYEGRSDLGNNDPGDGVKYKGRGLIQLTGKYNYEKFGSALGLDLVDNPEQASNAATALELAAAYWKDRGLNELADSNNFEGITKRINGGLNGLQSRQEYLSRANSVLNGVQVGNGLVKPSALNYGEATTALETNKGAPDTALLAKDEKLAAGYAINSNELLQALPNYQNINTLGEAFDAFYNSELGHTQSGLDLMSTQAARDANAANLKALEGKVPQEVIDSLRINIAPLTIGRSLNDFDKAVADFQAKYPDIKLPVSSSSEVYATVNKQMEAYDAEYAAINRGGWFDSQSSFFRNLGTVLGGYAPAGLLSIIQDPESLATNVTYGALAASGAGLLPAAAAFLGLEGVRETGVQLRRQGMGQEAPISEGLTRAGTATAGMLVLDGAAKGLGKLWKYGSSDTSKILQEVSSAVKKAENLSPEVKASSPVFEYASKADQLAKAYEVNPHGTDINARVKLEASIDAAYKDLLENKPVREFNDSPLRMTSADKSEAASFGKYIEFDGDRAIFKSAVSDAFKMLDDMRYGSVSTPVYAGVEEIPNTLIPVIRSNVEGPSFFDSVRAAQEFLSTKEGRSILSEHDVHILQQADGRSVLLRSADLEPAASASPRMSSAEPADIVRARVGTDEAVGLKTSEADLQIASKYPEQSFIRPLNQETLLDPLGYKTKGVVPEYTKGRPLGPDSGLAAEKNYYAKTSDAEISKEFESALSRLENLTPNRELDIGSGLGLEAAERVKIKDEIASIKEEKSAYQALKSCLLGE